MLFIQHVVCGQLPAKIKSWAGVVFFLSFFFKPAVSQSVGSSDLLRLVISFRQDTT